MSVALRRLLHDAGMSDYIVGVTGGVASGKSAVTRRFEALGVVVADADVAARAVVAPGQPALAEVVARFGAAVLRRRRQPGPRARCARRVFADDAARAAPGSDHPSARPRAAAATHARRRPAPMRSRRFRCWPKAAARDAYPWLRSHPGGRRARGVQRARLMQRDGIDAALAERMIAAQATRAQRLAIADDVIVNDGALGRLDDARARALDRALSRAGRIRQRSPRRSYLA